MLISLWDIGMQFPFDLNWDNFLRSSPMIKTYRHPLVLVAIFLILICIAFIIIQLLSDQQIKPKPDFNWIEIAYAIATIATVLLTIVLISVMTQQADLMKDQLGEMSKQLNVMEKNQMLQIQPLPLIEDLVLVIESPKLRHAEFKKMKYDSFNSRWFIKGKIKNQGNAPAVSLVASSHIHFNEPDNEKIIYSMAEYFETMKIVSDNKDDIEIIFSFNDEDAPYQMLKSINKCKLKECPKLCVGLFFKNVLGGSFKVTNQYLIYPVSDNDVKNVRDWLAESTTFHIKYKEEIEYLNSLNENQSDLWDNKFDEIENKLSAQFEDKAINTSIIPIVGGFRTEIIGAEEYNNIVSSYNYGVIMHPNWACKDIM
jgi:hypothetical protein